MHEIQKKAFTFQVENEVPPMIILSFQKFRNNKLRKINIIFSSLFFLFYFSWGDCQAVYRLWCINPNYIYSTGFDFPKVWDKAASTALK